MNWKSCVMLLFSSAALANTPPAPLPPLESAVTLDTLLVSGEQPGPGLWRVSHGENELWILGTQSPLPAGMVWRSAEVEALIAQSQEVLEGPSTKLDPEIGVVRGLFLLPSLFAARKNPDGKRLQDVLPPELYARWDELKQRYIGRKRSIEKWRPVFAVGELYSQAIKRSGLSKGREVWKSIEEAAKRNGVPVTSPTVSVSIDSPRATLKRFGASSLDDIECFSRTLQRLETDIDSMRLRANAWAVGDLERLRELPFVDDRGACRDAILGSVAVNEAGLADLPQRMADVWLTAAETSLKKNRRSVAVLSLFNLTGSDNYLDALRSRGYQVEEPE